MFRFTIQRQGPRDFFASQRRSLTPEDLPPLLTRRNSPHHSHERSPYHATAQQSTQEESEPGPHVHINGANSHVAFDRRSPAPAPDPHHSHHHHHHHGNHHDDHHRSKHTDDVVVIEGDNDNVHVGRRSPLPDPRHHHHHHHHHHHGRRHGENDVAAVKDDNGINRRSPDPRHDDHRHHHHDHHGHGHHKGHGGGDKVIIKGDDNNVSVHSRSRTVRHQHHDHSPEGAEVAAHEGHQYHVQARKYIPRHQPHHGGPSADHAERIKSAHHDDQDRTEKQTRSVLINSVEGEETYLVPDDYRDQRVTVIEGDGISKILTKVKRGDPGIEGVRGSVEIMVRFSFLSFAILLNVPCYLVPCRASRPHRKMVNELPRSSLFTRTAR